MQDKSINEQLKLLYSGHWENLIKYGNAIKPIPANPLLIKINEEEFKKSDLKVMIFGQETWDWHKFGTSIENGMNGYEKFFINKNFYNGYKKSAFWKGFNYFKKEIESRYKNTNITYIWNNISKIGRNDGKTGVTTDIRNLERTYFNVIKEEISILKPDIVIFLTGGRDNDLKFNFEDLSFKNIEITNKKITTRKYSPSSILVSKFLPTRSIRTYHPSYFGGFNYIKKDVANFIKPKMQLVRDLSKANIGYSPNKI